MKQFKYSLETILDYKTQVLDNLKTEHAEILHNVNRKQDEINTLQQELSGLNYEFNRTKSAGATIESFRLYDMCIESMEDCINTEKDRLNALKEAEAVKKKEVITAKIDTSKFEKIKDRKLDEYRKQAAKAEEAYIEEFVTRSALNTRNQTAG